MGTAPQLTEQARVRLELDSPDAGVRKAAGQRLLLADEATKRALTAAALQSQYADARTYGSLALVGALEPDPDLVQRALGSDHARVRQAGVFALFRLPATAAAPAIAAAQASADPLVKRAGEYAALAPTQALDPGPLWSDQAPVREAACFALLALDPPERAGDLILGLLEDHDDPQVRRAAAYALIQLEAPANADLVRLMQSPHLDVQEAASFAYFLLRTRKRATKTTPAETETGEAEIAGEPETGAGITETLSKQ